MSDWDTFEAAWYAFNSLPECDCNCFCSDPTNWEEHKDCVWNCAAVHFS